MTKGISKYNIWDVKENQNLIKTNMFIIQNKKRGINEQLEKNVLLVAHGGISIAINCYFNGIPANGEVLRMGLHNCEYAKYEFQRKIDCEER